MSSKSIITKTLKKMKTINPEKGVFFNDQKTAKITTTNSLLKAHVILTSKNLPTISRLNIEDEDNDQEEEEDNNNLGNKGTSKSNVNYLKSDKDKTIKSSFKRRDKYTSSKTIRLSSKKEILFNKIALANTYECFYSETDESFDQNEKVYVGLSYSANPAMCVVDFSYNDNHSMVESHIPLKAIAIENFEGNCNEGLFCFFEGHGGGSEIANYLQKNFRSAFHKAKTITSDIENALKIAFYSIDKEMEDKSLHYGSTGNVVYIKRENYNSVIYSANVGDSKTMLLSYDTMRELSEEHLVNNPKENKRLLSNGGMLLNDKLMGHFKLSRSFGDYNLKSFGVKCEPFINRCVIEDNDLFIIIGSGLMWSIAGEQNIQKIATHNVNSNSLIKSIFHLPSTEKTTNNIACYAIKLK